jgi:hypothetical protein
MELLRDLVSARSVSVALRLMEEAKVVAYPSSPTWPSSRYSAG